MIRITTTILIWLTCITLATGQTSDGEYLVKIDKYSFYAKVTNRFYPNDNDTVIKVFIPIQIDTVIRFSGEGAETSKTLDIIKYLIYDQFMGYITLNYLDTFFNKEIIVTDNGKKLKIDWLSISVFRGDGKHDRYNSATNKISQNKATVDFIKKAPIDSYIVIDQIWFYVGKKKEQTYKRIAWKVVSSNWAK